MEGAYGVPGSNGDPRGNRADKRNPSFGHEARIRIVTSRTVQIGCRELR